MSAVSHPRGRMTARRRASWVGGRQLASRSKLGVAAHLAPQSELLVDRAVGEAAQHGIAVRLVDTPVPRRHDDRVARTPGEGLHLAVEAGDRGAARALDHRDYGAIG